MDKTEKPIAELTRENIPENETATEQKITPLFSTKNKIYTLSWQGTSEIVGGLLLDGSIDKNSVKPEWFFPPYDNFIKAIKEGFGKERLIERCGIDPFNTCIEAAKNQNKTLDWLSMLKKSHKAAELKAEFEKASKQISRGTLPSPAEFDAFYQAYKDLKAEGGSYDSFDEFTTFGMAEAFLPREPREWIVKDLIPKGTLTVLYGSGKLGKTYTMMSLAASVATGRRWIEFETGNVNVLYIDEENGKRTMLDRWQWILNGEAGNKDTPILCMSLEGFNARDETKCILLQEMIEKHELGLVIIDPMIAIIPGADENTSKDVDPALRRLKKIAEESSCAVIIIHHANKQGKARGTSVFLDAPDLLINVDRMTEDAKDKRLKFSTEGVRHIPYKEFGGEVIFDNDTIYMTRCKIIGKENKFDQAILDCFTQSELLTTTEILDGCEPMNRRTIRDHIYAMKDKKLAPAGKTGKDVQWKLLE